MTEGKLIEGKLEYRTANLKKGTRNENDFVSKMGLKHSESLAELENAMIQFSQSGTKNVPIMNSVWIILLKLGKCATIFNQLFFFV